VRTLIAEDDATSRLILEAALAGFGHEVVAATDGEQAWQMFQAEKVEVPTAPCTGRSSWDEIVSLPCDR